MSDDLHVELIEAGFYGEDAKLAHNYCPFSECCGASLSELIEACGEQFYGLVKQNDGWEALSVYNAEGKLVGPSVRLKQVQCKGITPEEAVARLWLVLNEKKDK